MRSGRLEKFINLDFLSIYLSRLFIFKFIEISEKLQNFIIVGQTFPAFGGIYLRHDRFAKKTIIVHL